MLTVALIKLFLIFGTIGIATTLVGAILMR